MCARLLSDTGCRFVDCMQSYSVGTANKTTVCRTIANNCFGLFVGHLRYGKFTCFSLDINLIFVNFSIAYIFGRQPTGKPKNVGRLSDFPILLYHFLAGHFAFDDISRFYILLPRLLRARVALYIYFFFRAEKCRNLFQKSRGAFDFHLTIFITLININYIISR